MIELFGAMLAFVFSFLCINFVFNDPSDRSFLRRSPDATSLPIVPIILGSLSLVVGVWGLIKAMVKLAR